MDYTLKDLRNGRVALKNDGTLQQLEMVLREVFPNDQTPLLPHWKYLYFGTKPTASYWISADSMDVFNFIDYRSVQYFVELIAQKRQIVVTNDSIERLIKDLKFRANEIGLNVDVVFKQKTKI